MKCYALVKIGTIETATDPHCQGYEYAEEAEIFETHVQLLDALGKVIDNGPVYKTDLTWRHHGIDYPYYDISDYYAFEFEGEEVPDEDVFVDYAINISNPEALKEIKENIEGEGDFKLIYITNELSGYADFREAFERRKYDFCDSTLKLAIEFYHTYQVFSDQTFDNIHKSEKELDDSRIDYEDEGHAGEYHFCDFVNSKGEIIPEKLEAAKAEQGLD